MRSPVVWSTYPSALAALSIVFLAWSLWLTMDLWRTAKEIRTLHELKVTINAYDGVYRSKRMELLDQLVKSFSASSAISKSLCADWESISSLLDDARHSHSSLDARKTREDPLMPLLSSTSIHVDHETEVNKLQAEQLKKELIAAGLAALLASSLSIVFFRKGFNQLHADLETRITSSGDELYLDELEQSIWSLSPVLIIWLSHELEIIRMNKAAEQHFGSLELGKSRVNALRDILTSHLASPPWQGAVTVELPDKTESLFYCSYARTKDKSRELYMLHVPDEQSKNLELQHVMLRGIAHDLRGALTSVLLGLDLQVIDDEQASKQLDGIRTHLTDTIQMFNNFLSLERLILRRMVLLKEEMDLMQVLDAALDEIATGLSMEVCINATSGSFVIEADPYALTEAMTNLMTWVVSIADTPPVCRSSCDRGEKSLSIEFSPDPRHVIGSPSLFGKSFALNSTDQLAQQSLMLANHIFDVNGLTLSSHLLGDGLVSITIQRSTGTG